MLQSSPLRRHITNSLLFLRSQMPALSLPTRWSSVIQDKGNIWLAVFCTGEMLFPRMSMLLSPQSRLSAAFSLLIGVPPDLRLASTTNLLLLFLVEILQKLLVQSACSPTLLLSQMPGQGLIISSI